MSGDEAARSADASRPRGFLRHRELEDGRIEHRGEVVILVLALLVIPAIVLETSASDTVRRVAFVLNAAIWLGFAAELGFVLAVSTRRMRTLRAHWLDAAIVALSVPVMPAVLQGARALRLLRLLRFLRLAVFGARGAMTARHLFRPEGFRYVALLALLLVLVGGAALAQVEAESARSLEDGIWWAVVTITTVGYGDVAPATLAGRAIGILVMLLGIGFFAVLTATVAATFVRQDDRPDETREELRAISERLERIEQALRESST